MNRPFRHNRSHGLGHEPLTDEQLRRLAPSIFAEQAHESRSEKFTYIPTYELVREMRAEGFQPYSVKQGNSRIPGKENFTKHMIRFRHDRDRETAFRTGDTVHEIAMLNSHDGTSSYWMTSALFRIICLNGMLTEGDIYAQVKVPHRGDVLGQVVEGAYTVLEDAEKVMNRVEQFRAITLQPDARMALAEAVHAVRFDGQEHSPDPSDLLRLRRHTDAGADLWNTMNVIQENAVRGGLHFRRPRRDDTGRIVGHTNATSRAVKSVDGDTALNRAIWALTEKMAELVG